MRFVKCLDRLVLFNDIDLILPHDAAFGAATQTEESSRTDILHMGLNSISGTRSETTLALSAGRGQFIWYLLPNSKTDINGIEFWCQLNFDCCSIDFYFCYLFQNSICLQT
ncbi:hypothetical protein TNCT_536971 [Trichonephila clavata]|uniref:Uncharacterized protein n=1 Tax=Trichonephila clavata TaxID=2740835 RepID=A0A8X6G7E5_TRICU|nr:hypothetical protein TNCT_536971 [Trichonephila clavata]